MTWIEPGLDDADDLKLCYPERSRAFRRSRGTLRSACSVARLAEYKAFDFVSRPSIAISDADPMTQWPDHPIVKSQATSDQA